MERNKVLPEGTQRVQGANAQETNIWIAGLVAGLVKTTLGPKGMDKLLVDSVGDVTVTNDGVTILRELVIEHPVAKMMVEIAKTQENEIGDGTTTAVVLAGEFLNNAQLLLKKKIHPTIIAKGYQLACEESLRILKEIGINIEGEKEEFQKKILVDIAKTAMTGKGAESNRDHLAELVVESVMKVIEDKKIDIKNISVEKKTGESVNQTKIIHGIIVDKERVHPNMPKRIDNARIVLIDEALQAKTLDMDAKINITSPEHMQQFIQGEATQIKNMIDYVLKSKANVIFCGKNIDEAAQHFLAKNNVMAIKRISRGDMEKIAKATNANIVTNIDDLTEKDIGHAGCVEERWISDESMIFIEECSNPKHITIFVRGGTEQATAEVRRAIQDAIGDISGMIREPVAVGGAGACEIILSERLYEYAKTQKGRIQLAIESFAKSMEIIPETLAENAGLDPIDMVAEQKSGLLNNIKWPGIQVFEGKIIDSWKEGIIEPLKIKTQAILSASEVAVMILRIDDVVSIMQNPDELRGQRQAQTALKENQ